MKGPVEYEATLLIVSGEPRKEIEKISFLSSMETASGKYIIVPGGIRKIHDIHLDTKNRALEERGYGMRIREIDGAHLITVKGKARRDDRGGIERLELESPWSVKNLESVLEEVGVGGMDFPVSRDESNGQTLESDGQSPVKLLQERGFDIVQDRETVRQVANIFRAGDDGIAGGALLAELAMDSVTFHLQKNRDIKHHEVEVEAKASDGIPVVGEIVDCLVSRFPGVLQKWQFGKYFTGKAMERLLHSGELEGQMIGPDGSPGPGAYDIIESALLRGPPG